MLQGCWITSLRCVTNDTLFHALKENSVMNTANKPGTPTDSVIDNQRPTRVRFVILALISVGTMINYLDRTVLGIASPSLTKELALNPVVMGLVFSAFPGHTLPHRFPAACSWTVSDRR